MGQRIRQVVVGFICLAAAAWAVAVGTPNNNPQRQTAPATSITCVVAPTSGTTKLASTPRTDGYYAGQGKDGHFHAIQFMAGNMVRYAYGVSGDSAVTMPQRLRSDRFVSYDADGNFAMPAFNEAFSMSDFVGNSLVLTINSTSGCSNGTVRTTSVTLQFIQTPDQTA